MFGRLILQAIVLSSVVGHFALGMVSAQADNQVFQYFYFDEPHALRLDVSQIAILQSNPGLAGRPDLSGVGIAVADMTPWPIGDWIIVNLPIALRSSEGVDSIVAQLAATGSVAFVSPVFTGTSSDQIIITPDVFVRFASTVQQTDAESTLQNAGIGPIVEQDFGGIPGVYKIRCIQKNGFEVLTQINELAVRADVDFAESDLIFTGGPGFFPNDPSFPSCWGIHNVAQFGGMVDIDMDGPEAWDISTGDPSVVVVIIDTGVQQDHPDIHQITGIDSTGQAFDGGPVNSFDNHGTAVAGCVSATINNHLGTVGIAPNCKVASARTFVSIASNGSWTSQPSWTVNSLSWAVSIGAKVTNNSNYYGSAASAIITSKYAATKLEGLVHFASAGNFSSSVTTYPASLPSVNAVAALEMDGTLAGFSSWGIGLDFSAPGSFIYSTDRTGPDGYSTNDYTFVSGTSFASPYAAGVAALIRSVKPALTVDQVEQLMQQTAVDLGTPGFDFIYGWGLVNAFAPLAIDCNNNMVPDEQDIAGGMSDCNGNTVPDECEPDCNGNGVSDFCDIAFGPSGDCDGNWIPDECELGADCNQNGMIDYCDILAGAADCNSNAIPDTCDVGAGTSEDCNGNGILDECDVRGCGEASDTCGTGGNCCQATTPFVPGCECARCCTAICADDSFCCVVFWDSICAYQAQQSSECFCGVGLPGQSEDCNANIVPDECELTDPLNDCNLNGELDACEISLGSSFDCNANGRPDECDLETGESADCNANVIPDECEGTPVSFTSPGLSPIGFGIETLYTIVAPPPALQTVIVTCEASADLDLTTEYLVVFLNNNYIGTLFGLSGAAQECPSNPNVEHLELYPSAFNGFVGSGDAVFYLFSSVDIDAGACGGNSFAVVRVEYRAEGDCNGNSVLDACDIGNGVSADCNLNHRPDECELDCNENGTPDDCEPHDDCNQNNIQDICDLVDGSADCDANAVPDECQMDTDGDGKINACDPCPVDFWDDSDGDGFCNSDDGCPDDPAKVLPGACGCGVADDDSDNDTVADCLDFCPQADDRIFAPACAGAIPTVSMWGLVGFTLLLLCLAKVFFGKGAATSSRK